jgi:hypothetical protein
MCGMAGFVGRGNRGNLFLTHRRLAMTDIAGGSQPMWNEDHQVGVIYNGEIYNRAALRPGLAAKGHIFRSDHSDNEVLIHGSEWGERLAERLLVLAALDRTRRWQFDNDLVEFCGKLPHRFKFRSGERKYLLPDILARPKKGFGLPLARWLRLLKPPEGGTPPLSAPAVSRWQKHRSGAADHRLFLWTWLVLQHCVASAGARRPQLDDFDPPTAPAAAATAGA